MFCRNCGNKIDNEAQECPSCGNKIKPLSERKPFKYETGKSWTTAYVLCWFFGNLGAHRFYTGYTGIGLAQLFTLGGCGIWSLVDFATLSVNSYEMEDGRKPEGYLKVLGMIGLGFLIASAALTFLLIILIFGMAALSVGVK